MNAHEIHGNHRILIKRIASNLDEELPLEETASQRPMRAAVRRLAVEQVANHNL